MLLASTMIAVGESFKLGKNLGLDLDKLFDNFFSTGSFIINQYCRLKESAQDVSLTNYDHY